MPDASRGSLGVGRRLSLYRHVDDKDDLVDTVAGRSAERRWERAGRSAPGRLGGTGGRLPPRALPLRFNRVHTGPLADPRRTRTHGRTRMRSRLEEQRHGILPARCGFLRQRTRCAAICTRCSRTSSASSCGNSRVSNTAAGPRCIAPPRGTDSIDPRDPALRTRTLNALSHDDCTDYRVVRRGSSSTA